MSDVGFVPAYTLSSFQSTIYSRHQLNKELHLVETLKISPRPRLPSNLLENVSLCLRCLIIYMYMLENDCASSSP